MDLTLITPTGDRPEAFALCERWIKAQKFTDSYGWIVVDDGQVPTTCTMHQRYIRREPRPSDPPHTLTMNLRAAIPQIVRGSHVLFIEDDDYYGPDYLATYRGWLDSHAIVGEGMARYYHMSRKHWRLNNRKHASLAQTGIRAELVPLLEDLFKSDDPFIDLRLWEKAGPGLVEIDPSDSRKLHCSIKGLPGRKGIGIGHDEAQNMYRPDTGCCCGMLRRWVGRDADVYIENFMQVGIR